MSAVHDFRLFADAVDSITTIYAEMAKSSNTGVAIYAREIRDVLQKVYDGLEVLTKEGK
jgi:hypothetical protein